MAVVSLGRLHDRIRASFWLVPALCAVAAVILAAGLVAVDKLIGTVRSEFLFPGPPEGARSFLGSIITAMISITGLVFSITVVVLVLASGQFSPRILRNFLRDRIIQWTLGVFIATFVYAMCVIRAVLGASGSGAFVPRIAVTVAFVLVLCSVGLFIVYINHIVNSIRVSSVITAIGLESRELLETRYPADGAPQSPAPTLAGTPTVIANRLSGVVVSVHEAAVAEYAARNERVAVLVPRIGDYVPTGGPLFRIYGAEPDCEFCDHLLERVAIDDERTLEQDLAFGFRQLVDIAEKALSPGINDPTTACQALDAMHDLLRRLATRELPSGRVTDGHGRVGLLVPQYEFADFLQVALAEVWHYGRHSTQVPERLTTLLRDLDTAARTEHRPAIERWLSVIVG